MTMTERLLPGTRLAPNAADVAAKIMDGEAILINLTDGMYFSLDAAGGLVWALVEARATLEDMANVVSGHYDVDVDRAARDVHQLAQELLDARLVLVSEEDGEPAGAGRPLPSEARLPYAPPKLNAYHDMTELLALDPPHPGLADTLSRPLTDA
jgi:hypothetical protein